ncbi:MAG: hypothetical protein SWH54_16020 [Thermodesulfobacteriota bacterium]|nr:hypothetical protein [Thermodesulfobacteriota bacterium]
MKTGIVHRIYRWVGPLGHSENSSNLLKKEAVDDEKHIFES